MSDPTYVVMLYIYKGVHNWDDPNRKATRELALAVPVYVTQDKAIADIFVDESEHDPDYIYDIVQIPMDLEAIQRCIAAFETRREMSSAGTKD